MFECYRTDRACKGRDFACIASTSKLIGRLYRAALAARTARCHRQSLCCGLPAKTIKRPKFRRTTDEELNLVNGLVAQKHAALATPRQLARFLCGMASPAATRARLTRQNAFALLSNLPFAEVLIIAEAATGNRI